ncbi:MULTISPECIES: monovalent cation:proton antiporter-2 (CPA2) family protein [Chryseobacterium]|jgi:CPA2 family monovalent cation:H+ antiporter-2|uniref:CPA2 family monovalent cation:H+ antiporter-2 n=1 Tax=Chryseobacterium rhizosphaerae TaxID=395937 RepID=A0AAE3YDI5_9FLAO|nr:MULTISPECIES: monovalent cation:proton antiporter-2 (CPA2) family protein [Chryseobacterium]MBL3549754.1 cation:proton antiporter [Chryseobacterium sp. KMC2]MDC8101748.1 monovalent cation:proton antiporter-2 (CPA2) family protein [Chryseobacterium rhizosphaerae]MDR6528359.1 CPA2 family monovalent cation:H+ antiporter-2 [Chryseobacterium rhizosphaerae]REC75988.1 potassium transporter [Chryseobacterium rhizosphaerae]SMC87008.1 Kef-type potassium/proton antiporter, CPA2 family [Chryseobacteriu
MESSLAMNTLLFLGVAIIMVPLARKFGLSSVIGYILGGIIIGPYVLRLTGNNVNDIMHASEFGVIMLLFLVGLELEPRKFWDMRKKIMGLGLTQMVLTISLLFVIFISVGWRVDKAVAVAMCFALSSTAIVLQTLQEKNSFKTTAGEASFSTLLFQDISVIPILAILPIIANYKAKHHDNEIQILIQKLPEWLQAGTVIIGVALLILLGRYVFVPFLRYVSKSGMTELLTASSLFLVIGVSELMIVIGLSPALGAFLAGVMLANSEFRHELEAQINPFKGLLLAVFFVSVGSTINFNIIQQDPLFIFSTVFAVVTVKFIVLYAIGKFFRIDTPQSLFYAFALSQVGEFAFVLINYASDLYLLSPELNAQLMAVTAITMCITPILLIVNDKFITPKFIKEIPEEEHDFNILDSDVSQKKIIIVGFGHFGSTVGRLLKANKMSATVLDRDSDRVKLLRSYGFKVYYGDATRIPILRAAGIEDAEILILCLDDPDDNKFIAELVREHYPGVKIFVRAKNRIDAYNYLNNGINHIYRETLGTAVDMAVDVLHEAGMRKYAARRLGQRFMAIDKASIRKLARAKDDDDIALFTTKEILQREEELLAYDNLNFDNKNWEGSSSADEEDEEESQD